MPSIAPPLPIIISQSIPANPYRGLQWHEQTSNGDILQQWFWNGTYWLSPLYYSAQQGSDFRGAIISGNNQFVLCQIPNNRFKSILIEYATIYAYFNVSVNSNTDYFTTISSDGYQVYYYDTGDILRALPISIPTINTQGGANGQKYIAQGVVSAVISNSTPICFRSLWGKQGITGNSLYVTQTLEYRMIR